MVLIPIIGANILDIYDKAGSLQADRGIIPLIVGFMGAFIAGLLACKWMISLVKKGKLIYFAIYCSVVGVAAILIHFFA